MNVQQFEDNLSIYGSNVDKWPNELHKEQNSLLKKHPELKKKIIEEQEFEAYLYTRTIQQPSFELEQNIVTATEDIIQHQTTFSKIKRSKPLALSSWTRTFAACLVLGIIIGFLSVETNINSSSTLAELQQVLYFEENLL